MSYQKVDLNLFALFAALLEHHSVSAASRALGVTASAGSHGLARLRKLLGDELFVAGPTGMQPTARALDLAPGVKDGLAKLALALQERSFDPALEARTFVIAATDYASELILPLLVRRLADISAQINLRIFPLGRMDVVQQLDAGCIDIVMGWFGELPKRISRQTLLTEHEAIVVRAGHPLTAGPITKDRILSFPHIVVELTGSEYSAQDGYFDDRGVFRRVWIERILIETNGGQQGSVGRVAVTVPRYADVPRMIQETDMVATLPRRLALRSAARGDIAVLALPYPPLAVAHEMIWHERSAADPSIRWLLGEVAASGRDVEVTDPSYESGSRSG